MQKTVNINEILGIIRGCVISERKHFYSTPFIALI